MGRRGRPPYPDLLTPRQQEVLALVREGLSNREIAERLDITPDGAKFHVSEILTKIGVHRREEAARWRGDAPTAALHRRYPRWGPWRVRARIVQPSQPGAAVPRWHGKHHAGNHGRRWRLCQMRTAERKLVLA
jgi:DNA-binding CsgD family transcriptional regulator